MEKPPVPVSLVWEDDLRFRASSGTAEMILDGNSASGPSPVQTLAFSLAGCMAMDVVDILRKGRHAITTFSVKLVGTRADSHPHRFLSIQLHFEIHGAVPAGALERAIAMSRDKYCSVWHSMRQDIELTTAFDIQS
jgi:putative redox protein